METIALIIITTMIFIGILRDLMKGRKWRMQTLIACSATKLILWYVATPVVFATTLAFPSVIAAIIWNAIDIIEIAILLSLTFSLARVAIRDATEICQNWGAKAAH